MSDTDFRLSLFFFPVHAALDPHVFLFPVLVFCFNQADKLDKLSWILQWCNWCDRLKCCKQPHCRPGSLGISDQTLLKSAQVQKGVRNIKAEAHCLVTDGLSATSGSSALETRFGDRPLLRSLSSFHAFFQRVWQGRIIFNTHPHWV